MGFYDAGLTFVAANATPRTLSQSDLYELCSTAGWTGTDIDTAISVVLAESSGKSDATSANPDGNENIGLFQIDTVNVRCGNCLKDTVYNANVAHRMWLADGGTFTKRWQTAAEGNLPKVTISGPSNEATNPVDTASQAVTGAVSSIGDFFGNLNLTSVLKIVGGGLLALVAVVLLGASFMEKVR